MAKIGTMKIAGKSGTEYAFELYPFDTVFKSLGAVYIVTKREAKKENPSNKIFGLTWRFRRAPVQAQFPGRSARQDRRFCSNSGRRIPALPWRAI